MRRFYHLGIGNNKNVREAARTDAINGGVADYDKKQVGRKTYLSQWCNRITPLKF